MKKILVLALAVSVFTMAAFFGSQRMCRMTMTPGRSPIESLGLSDAQKAQIQEIENKYSASENAICMELCRKRADLVRMLARKDSVDAEVGALIDSIGAVDAKLEKEIAAHVLDVKRLLNDEQAAKYVESLRSEMRCPIVMKAPKK